MVWLCLNVLFMCLLDVEKVLQLSRDFWENGDPIAEWHDITEEDMQYGIYVSQEPVPKADKKKPAFPRSGSH